MKLLITVFVLLIVQLLLEALVMAILIKIGVPYLEANTPNDSYIETFFAMLVYVALSKIIYLGILYILIMMVLHYYLNKEQGINYRVLIFTSPLVNLGLFIPIWLYYRGANYLWNPIISTVAVSLIICLVSLRVPKVTSNTKN